MKTGRPIGERLPLKGYAILMTTTAATWFYRAPEKTAFLLEERLRTSFWDQRLGSVWLNVVSLDGPIVMEGQYDGAHIKLEWEPNHWMRVSTRPAQTTFIQAMTNLLRRRPTLRYDDPSNNTVWEWRVDDADPRWREIQGKPAFGNLQRLDNQN